MLHIVLTVLKILGILILCILALIVTVLALVMFVPVRYQIRAGKQDSVRASLKVTWLLHLVSIRFFYEEDKPGSRIRILGIPLNAGGEKKSGGDKSGGKKRRDEEDATDEAGIERWDEEDATDEAGIERRDEEDAGAEGVKESENGFEPADAEKPGLDAGAEGGSGGEGDDGVLREPGFFEKLKQRLLTLKQRLLTLYWKLLRFLRRMAREVKKIRYTFSAICDKIKNAKENADYYLEVLSEERHREAIGFVKSQAWRLLKHIGPTKIKGSFLIGMDDPAATGQVLAVLGMFYPLYGKNIRIVPEFGRTVFLGELLIKGRVMAFVLLRIAWRIYFNRDFKHLIRAMKKEEA